MECPEVLRKAKPYFLMIFLQFGFAGMYVISVASLKQGMNHYVLVVYRNAVAAVVMAPFAFWFERYPLLSASPPIPPLPLPPFHFYAAPHVSLLLTGR